MPTRAADHTVPAVHGSVEAGWGLPFSAALFAMLTLQMTNLGVSPLLPALQSEFRFSYSQLGLFAGLFGVLAVLLSVPAGLAARRFGERRVLLFGLAVVAIGLALLSAAEAFTGALAGRIVWAAGYRFTFVAVLTAVAVTTPARLKSMSMGIVGSVASLSSVIGAPLGGLVAASFGWRHGLLAFTATTGAGLLLAWAFYRPSHRTTTTAAPARRGLGGAGSLGRPLVWALAALVGIVGMISFTVTNFVPSVARAAFGLDAAAAGWLISSGYLLAMVCNLVIGYVMDRTDRWTIMSVIALLLIPASLLLTMHDLVVFRIATAITLALGFTATNQVYALAREVMDAHDAAGAIGALGLGAGVFAYVGPQALGVLRDQTGGFAVGWYVMAGTASVALLVLLTLRRAIRTRG